jgi:acyl dehydratase
MEPVELQSAPSLSALYARAVTTALLPGGGDQLPDRELLLRGVELRREHVADYARVCGFTVRDTVPGTFPHILAFPLQMKLMTERSFPFSVLGLVHIANRIEVLAPIPVGARLDYSLRTENLRPHRSGRQFDMVVEARLDERPAWRGRSTYLHRGDGDRNEQERKDSGLDQGSELTATAVWQVPGDIGRRYAGVSGDRNPIHMHPLSARAFGFPTAIAHGMWSKARCLASFDGRLPPAYAIEVEFGSPLRVPAKARFLSGERDSGFAFRLETMDGRHRHLLGSISPAT